MIYLNNGSLKPMIILMSFLLLPTTVTCCILAVSNFRNDLFIVSTLLLSSYFLIVFCVYKYSKSKKFYLFVEDSFIVIKYPNITNEGCGKIFVKEVLKIEYYRISSIKAWCMLHNFVCPQCAYVTYLHNGKEVCKHIGYPRSNEIHKLCVDTGIYLCVK